MLVGVSLPEDGYTVTVTVTSTGAAAEQEESRHEGRRNGGGMQHAGTSAGRASGEQCARVDSTTDTGREVGEAHARSG